MFSQLFDIFIIIRNYTKKMQTDCLPELSERLAHLQSCNTLTTKITKLLAELNIR